MILMATYMQYAMKVALVLYKSLILVICPTHLMLYMMIMLCSAKAHNIFIDTSTAKLYACASNNAMDVYSLANPVLPVLINELNDPTIGHVHDAYVKNDTAYLNCGNDGFRVFDYSNVNSISNQP